jgi:hypothetical protein
MLTEASACDATKMLRELKLVTKKIEEIASASPRKNVNN